MRAAMQRHPHPQRRLVARRQQQTVAAEIVEADPVAADMVEQLPEGVLLQQLPGQQMVPLHPRLIAG
jgi:hypothetical protein